MQTEIWKPIPSCCGVYEASSLGRVRRIYKTKQPRIMTQFDGGLGYLSVGTSVAGKFKSRTVHSLVCEAFHGPKPKGKDGAAHFDGNPMHNIPSNLRWATFMENKEDQIRHGRILRGSMLPFSVLNEDKAEQGLVMWNNGGKIKAIARAYGLSQRAMQCLIYGETWRHVAPNLPRKKRLRAAMTAATTKEAE